MSAKLANSDLKNDNSGVFAYQNLDNRLNYFVKSALLNT